MIIFLFPSIFSTIWELNPRYYDFFDKLLRLEKVKLFSRQDKILDIKILILYRKQYMMTSIISIIVLNIEAKQYNIKINLAISCSPNLDDFNMEFDVYYTVFLSHIVLLIL